MPTARAHDIDLQPLLSERLAATVKRLRTQLERSRDRQLRSSLADVVVRRQNKVCLPEMSQQLTVLEGLLRAWMPHLQNSTNSTVAAEISGQN